MQVHRHNKQLFIEPKSFVKGGKAMGYAHGLRHTWQGLYIHTLLSTEKVDGHVVYKIQAIPKEDALQDMLILLGADVPYGGLGSEFGGFEIEGIDGSVSASTRGYIRLSCFF